MEESLATMAKQKLSMDIPTNPTFSIPTIGNSVLDPIQFDFVLLNMDNNALKKNFEFLHALFAGTQWLQFPGGTIKSTNVYNVYCPGRFHIFWAALDMSVKADGKLRLCPEVSKTYSKIKSIGEDTLWPEVWKVSINIKSLTPNNFNAYIHHFVHGFEEGTIKLLAGNYREQNIAKHMELTDPLKEFSANGTLNLGLTKEERAQRMAQVKSASETNLAKRKARLRAKIRTEIDRQIIIIKNSQDNDTIIRAAAAEIRNQRRLWYSVGGTDKELGLTQYSYTTKDGNTKYLIIGEGQVKSED